jgi:hypothetical protein
MSCQELQVAKLAFWLLVFRELTDVILVEAEILEVLVDEALSKIFSVSALPTLRSRSTVTTSVIWILTVGIHVINE